MVETSNYINKSWRCYVQQVTMAHNVCILKTTERVNPTSSHHKKNNYV